MEALKFYTHWLLFDANHLWQIGYLGLILGVSGLNAVIYDPKTLPRFLSTSLMLLVSCGIIQAYYFTFDFLVYIVLIALPIVLLTIIFNSFSFDHKEKRKVESVFDVLFTAKNGRIKFVLNLLRGGVVFGAAGSGKTATKFARILKHMIFKKLSGVVYDHKDFELAEIVYYFNQLAKKEGLNPLKLWTVCFHQPAYSHRVNPIDPKYLTQVDDIKVIAQALMDNLGSSDESGDNYFRNGARAAISGCICRLKEDFPDQCSIPYVCAIMTTQSVKEIVHFLEGHPMSKMLAAPFLDARSSANTMASLKSSVTDALVNIISPSVFYVLSGNDFDLSLNKNEDPAIALLVNKPGKEAMYNSLHALIFTTIQLEMCHRNRNPSLVVLDEAGQIKFNKLYNIPALLRSFNIGTIFGIQDKVQGNLLYKENEIKALLANLSTKMFGKSNLPETSKFYEQYFELIKIKQKSISQKQATVFGSSADKRETISDKEEAKHRAFEFDKLKSGEFHVFDENGKHMFNRWDMIEFTPVKPFKIHDVSEYELEINFNEIVSKATYLGLSQEMIDEKKARLTQDKSLNKAR